MIKSSTRLALPLVHGVSGCVDAFPFTQTGTPVPPIKWLTPMEVQYPDGWNIFRLHTTPTLMLFEGFKVFEIWDHYMLPKPRLVGRVKINCDANTYEVELERRYRCFKLTLLVLAHHQPQEPFEPLSLQNNTPFGEWVFRNAV